MRSILYGKYPEVVRKHVRGVIQVGAHQGDECEMIWDCDIKNQIYIEPLPGPYKLLMEKVRDRGKLFNVACSYYNGESKFFLNVGDYSSSFFDVSENRPPEHRHNYHIGETTVKVVRLDDLLAWEKFRQL
jgi:FkbM family methyltransferase